MVSSYAYPVAEGTNTENQTIIYYYIVCPGMKGDVEQEQIIDNLFELMSLDSSILMQNLKKALPGGSFSFGRELAAPDDAIVFLARNVNEDDGRLFKETVDASLKEFAEKGFDEDMVDSAMASLNLSTKLAPEAADPVEGVVYSLAYNYAVTGNPFSYVENVESLSHLKEWNSGLYQQAAARWLLDQDTWTLTTTYPAAGEKEKHDEALAAMEFYDSPDEME